MDLKILGNLLDGLDAFERLEGHAGFEFGVVSSSFCFIWCVGSVYTPRPHTTIIA